MFALPCRPHPFRLLIPCLLFFFARALLAADDPAYAVRFQQSFTAGQRFDIQVTDTLMDSLIQMVG